MNESREEGVKSPIGRQCTIDVDGDVMMDFDAREFIGKQCVIKKILKSGLIEVSLVTNKAKTHAFPRRNIALLMT